MEPNGKLKEINIKICMSYYFDDIIEIEDFDLVNILIDGNSYKIGLFCNILYKSLIAALAY